MALSIDAFASVTCFLMSSLIALIFCQKYKLESRVKSQESRKIKGLNFCLLFLGTLFNQRTNSFAISYFFKVAFFVHIKNNYRQFVFLAKGNGGHIHYI